MTTKESRNDILTAPCWNLKQIADWTGAQIISEHQTQFQFIGTDTRTDLTGKIFVALKGDNYDAHNYLDMAVKSGAKALLVHDLPEKFSYLKTEVSILKVNDTLKGLQDFSKCYRQSLKTKIIGITGSNGKTTTKEFTAQIISTVKKTHYSHGSFNNHWGVPMTLLSIPTDTEVAVVEMGMNHSGEIQQLVEIADPDIVVCTMVGSAHIEFFGTQKKIAEAKSEIYMYSRESCVRVFNQDQDLTFDMMYPVAKKFPESRMLSFSQLNNEADVYFKIEQTSQKGLVISGLIGGKPGHAVIPVFGKHNLTNLMAASCLAYSVGLSPEQIWKALPFCQTAWGRNQFIETEMGASILFDGYNANPDSMYALLDNLKLVEVKGRRIAVFGQMKELGQQAAEAHQKLAEVAAESKLDAIVFCGENAKDFEKGLSSANYQGEKLVYLEFSDELQNRFKQLVKANDFVAIKGSRGAQTERFVKILSPLNWIDKK